MKYSTIIAAAAALTGSIVSAQGITDIPQCALGCAISSLGSTGCQTTDFKCICQATAFITQLTPCVQSACSAADLEKTIQAATALCASAGVSLVIPSATSAAVSSTAISSAPVTLSVAVSTTTATEAVSTTTAAVSTLTTSVSSVYVAPNATATTGGSGNGTVAPTVTSAVPTVSPSGNAAARNSVAIGGIVLAFAAALL